MQKVKFTKTEKKLLEYLKKKNGLDIKPNNKKAANISVKPQAN